MHRGEYTNLVVRQKAMDLVDVIYGLTKDLPKEEVYGLTAQMKRAAVSIPMNIAEGNGRRTEPEFKHFLVIAHGSCVELETSIYICHRQQYISLVAKDDILQNISIIRKMICKLGGI